MMLGLHGRPNPDGVNVGAYDLAYRLKMTLDEVRAMPSADYVGWQAYFTARHAMESKSPVGGAQ